MSNCELSHDFGFTNLVQELVTFVDQLLPKIGKFLKEVKGLLLSKIQSAVIIHENKILQQDVRTLLLTVKEGFLKACVDLVDFTTDESVLTGVREDRSQTREQLKSFVSTCRYRFNICIDGYNEFRQKATKVVQQIGKATSSLSTKLENAEGNKKFHSLLTNIGVVTGIVGTATAAGAIFIAAAPITVPAAILCGIGAVGGTAAVGGVVGGKIASDSKCISISDVKILKAALDELSNLQDIINTASTGSFACNKKVASSQNNLKSFQWYETALNDPMQAEQHTQQLQHLTDDSNQECKMVDFALKELEKNMKRLRDATQRVEIDTEESLNTIPS